MRQNILLFAIGFLLAGNINAQENQNTTLNLLDKSFLNWYNSDPETNGIQGVSADRTYIQFLKNRPARKKIIVAIISDGIDVKNSNIIDNIWVNIDEIPNNEIDDDKNGYIDDINGWDFIDTLKDENNNTHGTFIAGIIAANRDAGEELKGIAKNLEIMSIRSIPNIDEHYYDIALSIRYAVDNEANIINIDFGKQLSPETNLISEAIKYADEKNVLIISGAGDNAQNLDIVNEYPTNILKTKNCISVAASSNILDKNFCGNFSNYGQKNVDVFAPGVNIISAAPKNKFSLSNGTNYAAAVATGVVAIVWSYYPELTAIEMKDILLKSSLTYPTLTVSIPNITSDKKGKAKFSTLSSSGGVVNALSAIRLANNIINERRKLEKK